MIILLQIISVMVHQPSLVGDDSNSNSDKPAYGSDFQDKRGFSEDEELMTKR